MGIAAIPEIALALSERESIDRIISLGKRPYLMACLERLGCPEEMIENHLCHYTVSRLHFGNEFCERLIPKIEEWRAVQTKAEQMGMKLTLALPMMTDYGIKRVDKLLPHLESGTEILINDWGILQRLRTSYPSMVPILGRMLNKMVKDPRLPSEKWTCLHPYRNPQGPFQALLKRFNITQLEMDVPPFAKAEQFDAGNLKLSVHLPYGFTFKGRMCRIGSLNQKEKDKFLVGHSCQKECLKYGVIAERPGRATDTELYSFQRGNSQFYRHSEEMGKTLWAAVAHNHINRLIFAGDWHENHYPAE